MGLASVLPRATTASGRPLSDQNSRGGSSRHHLHSLMARRATPSIRTPLGNSIISQAAGPNHSFAAPVMMSSNPMNITDININSTILEDLLQGIELEPLLDQIPATMSNVISQALNDFISAGINTELLAPGKDTDQPEHMKHEDGSDGTFTIGEDADQMLMPSSDLIIERNSALSELNGSEKIDPKGKIIDSNISLITEIITAVLDVLKVRHQQELSYYIETEVLPTLNEKIDNIIAECNARLSDFQREVAEAEERASVAATETNDSNRELEHNYETAMIELNELAIIMNKFEKALTQLNDQQYYLQEEQLDAVIEVDDESEKAAAKQAEKIEIVGARIQRIQSSIENATGRIRTILTQRCNIPEKVRAEFAITTIKEKLPEKLNGKPDPLIAAELTSFINKLISTYPEQLWSIVPTLHRLINIDHTAKGELGDPPSLENGYSDVPYELQPYYASHNQRLFDVLTIMGSQAVQRAMSSFSTGDDDISLRRTSHASQADGISVLAWHMHYHEQSGYQIRAELQNYLNYAHGAFVDQDPVIAVTTIRKKLREAERLGIKLEYDMSCRRIVEVIRRRDVSFVSPIMER